ncbi:MAG: 6-phosphogluconolactonase [Motiliproteus sp.]
MNDLFSSVVAPTRFDTRPALDRQLGGEIAERLRAALAVRDRASLVVSGGRTPVGLFKALSRIELDWSRVIITLADERWVSPDNDDSNERLVRAHLIQNLASAARFISLKTSAASAADGAAECGQRLTELPSQLDVVILGMGEDGHTASFFPGAETLQQALDPHCTDNCLAVTPPVAPHDRMTLSLARILRCDQIYLHLCGDAKLPVLAHALESGPAEAMPVRAILRQVITPVAVYWAP